MIFKVVANVAPVYIADLWNSSNTLSEEVTVGLDTTTAHSGHYKNRIVLANNWRTFNPSEVCKRVTFLRQPCNLIWLNADFELAPSKYKPQGSTKLSLLLLLLLLVLIVR